jgi:hypothetical protein
MQMEFTESYLRRIINLEVAGDFAPYNSGDRKNTDEYIQKIIVRLQSIPEFIITTEAESYGSGFASFTHISISKKDKSDTIIHKQAEEIVREETKGLLLYICRLAPYAVFATSEWSYSFEHGRASGGTYQTMLTKKIDQLPEGGWIGLIEKIRTCLNEFKITILTKEELARQLPFQASIPTMLSDAPYKLFDCFFYWEE